MKKKLLTLLTIALVTALVVGAEYIHSKQYVVTILNDSPDQIEADGQTQVQIDVKVTKKNGLPCTEHDIYGYSMNGGGFKAYRVKTDKEGIARFVYIPYKSSDFQKAGNVVLKFLDQSNSYIIRIPAQTSHVLPLLEHKEEDSGKKVDDIFG